jgi:hypothetical protein
VVDKGALTTGAIAARHAVAHRGWSEHVGAFLGDADQHHSLTTLPLGGVQAGLGDLLLAHALLEADDRMP